MSDNSIKKLAEKLGVKHDITHKEIFGEYPASNKGDPPWWIDYTDIKNTHHIVIQCSEDVCHNTPKLSPSEGDTIIHKNSIDQLIVALMLLREEINKT